jgi:large subunit ribosomal protein L10
MPRPEKVRAVEDIKDRMEEAEAFFLTEFRGLSVGQLQRLRRNLREAGADYRVVKMTLARRAADELGLEGVGEHLSGPTALTFAESDPVATAKALADYAKDNERLVVKLGVMAGRVMLPEEVSKLATIEPREVLLAKIAGAAKAPLAQMAGALGAFTRNAASMFSQLLEKKESEAGPAAEPVAAEPEPEVTEPAAIAAALPEPEVTEPAAIAAAEPEPEVTEPAAIAAAEPEPEVTEPAAIATAEPEPGVTEPETPTDDTDEPAATAEEE